MKLLNRWKISVRIMYLTLHALTISKVVVINLKMTIELIKHVKINLVF